MRSWIEAARRNAVLNTELIRLFSAREHGGPEATRLGSVLFGLLAALLAANAAQAADIKVLTSEWGNNPAVVTVHGILKAGIFLTVTSGVKRAVVYLESREHDRRNQYRLERQAEKLQDRRY